MRPSSPGGEELKCSKGERHSREGGREKEGEEEGGRGGKGQSACVSMMIVNGDYLTTESGHYGFCMPSELKGATRMAGNGRVATREEWQRVGG
jgi:hypothetical protein